MQMTMTKYEFVDRFVFDQMRKKKKCPQDAGNGNRSTSKQSSTV